MKRNIIGFGALALFYVILMHGITGIPYVASFIVFPPLTMGIGLITIPPLIILTREKVVDYNYDDTNVVITVAFTQIALILTVLYLSGYANQMSVEQLRLMVIVVSFGIDVIAFIRDIYKPWVIILVLLHICVFVLLGTFPTMHPFYIECLLGYLLVHMVVTISYAVLRYGYSIQKAIEYVYDTIVMRK